VRIERDYKELLGVLGRAHFEARDRSSADLRVLQKKDI
jgi:hypothetical protein